MHLEQWNLSWWVDAAADEKERAFRQAVHTVLHAVASSRNLYSTMIMKGGVLLAVKYESSRHTRDVDFSTRAHFNAFDEEGFIRELEESLVVGVQELDYGLDCLLQSKELRPKRDGGNFQTLRLTIGYAYLGSRSHRLLQAGNSPTVVRIDYSFNELIHDVDKIELPEGGEVMAYGYGTLVAEKLRAILQQQLRRRTRRQDVYDLYYLFEAHPIHAEDKKGFILNSLLEKAASRGLAIDRDSMRNPDIIEASRSEYHLLEDEIEGELPPFEEAYGRVQEFYESLPWPAA